MKDFIAVIMGVSALGGIAVSIVSGLWIMLGLALGLMGAGLAVGFIGVKLAFDSAAESDDNVMIPNHACAG